MTRSPYTQKPISELFDRFLNQNEELYEPYKLYVKPNNNETPIQIQATRVHQSENEPFDFKAYNPFKSNNQKEHTVRRTLQLLIIDEDRRIFINRNDHTFPTITLNKNTLPNGKSFAGAVSLNERLTPKDTKKTMKAINEYEKETFGDVGFNYGYTSDTQTIRQSREHLAVSPLLASQIEIFIREHLQLPVRNGVDVKDYAYYKQIVANGTPLEETIVVTVLLTGDTRVDSLANDPQSLAYKKKRLYLRTPEMNPSGVAFDFIPMNQLDSIKREIQESFNGSTVTEWHTQNAHDVLNIIAHNDRHYIEGVSDTRLKLINKLHLLSEEGLYGMKPRFSGYDDYTAFDEEGYNVSLHEDPVTHKKYRVAASQVPDLTARKVFDFTDEALSAIVMLVHSDYRQRIMYHEIGNPEREEMDTAQIFHIIVKETMRQSYERKLRYDSHRQVQIEWDRETKENQTKSKKELSHTMTNNVLYPHRKLRTFMHPDGRMVDYAGIDAVTPFGAKSEIAALVNHGVIEGVYVSFDSDKSANDIVDRVNSCPVFQELKSRVLETNGSKAGYILVDALGAVTLDDAERFVLVPIDADGRKSPIALSNYKESLNGILPMEQVELMSREQLNQVVQPLYEEQLAIISGINANLVPSIQEDYANALKSSSCSSDKALGEHLLKYRK